MHSAPVQMACIQWASLPDIAAVPTIGDDDYACLADLRDVLVRHKSLHRFGVHLLHKHFEVADDEVMVEYTDTDARTLQCQVEKRAYVGVDPSNRIETMWSFAGEGATRVCDQQCVYNNGHANRHYRRS